MSKPPSRPNQAQKVAGRHADEIETPQHVRGPSGRENRSRLRHLVQYIKPYKRTFYLSVATAIVSTAFASLVPFLFRYAIDKGVVAGDASDLRFWIIIAGFAIVADWFTLALSTYWSFWSVRVVNDLRSDLYRHISRQGLDFFSDRRTGTVISRLTNDIEALGQVVNDGVFMVFVNILKLVLIEAFLFALDPRLALAVNIIFPIMLIATVVFRYYSSRAYRKTRERMALVTAYLAETLAGMRIVQAFAAEERVAREFDETNRHYRKANYETIWLSAAYFPFVELLAATGTAIVLWYGGYLTTEQALTVGVLFAFIAYLDNFFEPIQQLSQFYGSYLSGMAALDKIMRVIETEPTIVDGPDATTLDTVRGDVEFSNVTFRYNEDGPDVLRDANLTVTAGETIAIVGHTGAGKSTFVKLLTRFYDPTRGTITLDGRDIRNLKQTWLRRSMGIVPQEGFLFSTTVLDNIAYGRPDASRADIEAAAKAVGADEFIAELEDGYETEIGERGGRLSAGQRQMIAFARAMLADPKLLVLDEATSSVDVRTELRLAAGLQALVAGRTAFIVAHRLSTIRDADRIVVVDDGELVEQGTHDELISRGGFYANLYGSWSADEPTIEECLAPETP